ncbi:hypothetical protein HZS_697 [Henneguya salminicola]|nr:hypothetical protein HZS_697 [Henneguya salminicola]
MLKAIYFLTNFNGCRLACFFKMEGFICPNCHDIFDSSQILTSHFSNCDENSIKSANQSKSHSKAESGLEGLVLNCKITKPIDQQISGHFVSHTANFKNIRRTKNTENSIVCNRTILRLRKLRDINQKYGSNLKEAQQHVVSWDFLAISCYICENSFNFFRRQHHCRTCGTAICSNCLKIMDFDGKYFFPYTHFTPKFS